jgi:hypothetical protein
MGEKIKSYHHVKKANYDKTTPVNSAVTADISLPTGEIPLSPRITNLPIFVTTKCTTEKGPCCQLSLNI